jgi:hypothetical protein
MSTQLGWSDPFRMRALDSMQNAHHGQIDGESSERLLIGDGFTLKPVRHDALQSTELGPMRHERQEGAQTEEAGPLKIQHVLADNVATLRRKPKVW